jgi:serine O-acetyltransferase
VPGVPQLGADVTIHQGAKVLGGVRLGDGVVISANAVVTKDVPAGVVIQSPIPRVRRSDEGGVPGGSAATPPGEPEG